MKVSTRETHPSSALKPALAGALAALLLSTALAPTVRASDHLDSPATVAKPQADIGDVYAWTSPEGRKLNLVMTIQGHTFSDKVDYVFHVDSGKVFGHTSDSTSVICRFASANEVNCKVGNADSASGDPTKPTGLEGRNHRFRVYAGLRDDPFNLTCTPPCSPGAHVWASTRTTTWQMPCSSLCRNGSLES